MFILEDIFQSNLFYFSSEGTPREKIDYLKKGIPHLNLIQNFIVQPFRGWLKWSVSRILNTRQQIIFPPSEEEIHLFLFDSNKVLRYKYFNMFVICCSTTTNFQNFTFTFCEKRNQKLWWRTRKNVQPYAIE